jgi:hypothetical protein
MNAIHSVNLCEDLLGESVSRFVPTPRTLQRCGGHYWRSGIGHHRGITPPRCDVGLPESDTSTGCRTPGIAALLRWVFRLRETVVVGSTP